MKRAVFALCVLLCAVFALSARAETLAYNSEGEAVRALQAKLQELGYYTFRITGVYQENTQKAVRQFQQAHGLPVTGAADEALQQLIFSSVAAPVPTPTPLVLLTPFPGKVQYGNQGDNVRRIQTRLHQLSYYYGDISGNYLDNTQAAIRAFQRQNGLPQDGVVGEQTWQALFFDAGAVDASATPKPTPAPTPVPYRVTVDVTNQVTTVYGLDENEDYSRMVRQMICSTGTASAPTNPGTYTLNGATARWSYFPKWGTHAQYWTRIDAYNAFHSVIYSRPDSMALSTGSYTGLGKRASNGCIRLMIEDAKWIYNNIGKGTRVIVFEGAPDPELTQALRVPPLDRNTMLPVPTPQPTPPPDYSESASPPLPFQTLKRGAESEAVYWLQCKLRDLGYYKGSVTGGYYEGTIEAVKNSQRDHGLSVDGHAGPLTQGKLYEAVLEPPASLPAATALPRNRHGDAPASMPAPTATPYEPWFEVD